MGKILEKNKRLYDEYLSIRKQIRELEEVANGLKDQVVIPCKLL